MARNWGKNAFSTYSGDPGSDPVLGKIFSSRRVKKGPHAMNLWTLGMISGMFFDAFRVIFKY